MVLESTVICVDNSEYMRNGDYLPTRLQAQQEAVTLVCRSKVRSNPENNVALITLTKGEVLVTLTNDVGRVLSRLYQVQPCGDINLNIGMKIAQLALKHRQGKNHKMRIVAFVGSPIVSEQEELIKLAKKLKKEKVNVDIVNFGEEEINTEILSDFVNILNGTDGTGSHLITVPPCPHLTEALIFSPIIQGEDGSSGVNLNNYEFGVDPNEDPELALALRISMEEQRQRQSQDSRKSKDSSPKLPNIEEMPNENDNEMLEFQSMTEDEQIAFALQMSMQDFQGTQKKQDEDDDDYSEIMNDPEFLQNVLENLPGVDPQSETVRKAVDNLTEKKKDDDEKKGEKK